jgi:hypothetical protein
MEYDTPALNAHLKRIKDRFPASKIMVMVPDDNINHSHSLPFPHC